MDEELTAASDRSEKISHYEKTPEILDITDIFGSKGGA